VSKLKAARKQLGLTVAQVADRAGVTVGFVSRVERGLVGVRPETAKRLAEVLSLDPADVIFAERVERAA
jgi:transcriptional regulator with XRE-family HTH domain